MRFAKVSRGTNREITPRRIAAAKRHLRKEREKLALFADEVAEMQPTPVERIELHDDCFAERWQNFRDLHAKQWRKGRRWLREHPEHADEILERWNASMCPADAPYFCTKIRRILREKGIELE